MDTQPMWPAPTQPPAKNTLELPLPAPATPHVAKAAPLSPALDPTLAKAAAPSVANPALDPPAVPASSAADPEWDQFLRQPTLKLSRSFMEELNEVVAEQRESESLPSAAARGTPGSPKEPAADQTAQAPQHEQPQASQQRNTAAPDPADTLDLGALPPTWGALPYLTPNEQIVASGGEVKKRGRKPKTDAEKKAIAKAKAKAKAQASKEKAQAKKARAKAAAKLKKENAKAKAKAKAKVTRNKRSSPTVENTSETTSPPAQSVVAPPPHDTPSPTPATTAAADPTNQPPPIPARPARRGQSPQTKSRKSSAYHTTMKRLLQEGWDKEAARPEAKKATQLVYLIFCTTVILHSCCCLRLTRRPDCAPRAS